MRLRNNHKRILLSLSLYDRKAMDIAMRSTKEFETYMRTAIQKAARGVRNGQTPFGACVVREGRVVSCAHNLVWKNTDCTAHAEIIALRQACRKLGTVDLSGSIMVSTCEPCPMCYSACHWARVSTIVFGARIEDARRYGFNELMISNEALRRMGKGRISLVKDCLRTEALKLFEAWKGARSRRVY